MPQGQRLLSQCFGYSWGCSGGAPKFPEFLGGRVPVFPEHSPSSPSHLGPVEAKGGPRNGVRRGKNPLAEQDEGMTEARPHICVCICTYKRERLLKRLLEELDAQRTGGSFTYSVVVADNDPKRSALPVVEAFRTRSSLELIYCVQPRQSISLTRNTALEKAQGEYVAFIDDDEYPVQVWLETLYQTCLNYHVDGVLGPVKPYYEAEPPRWVTRGNFHERFSGPTGHVLSWPNAGIGNVLFKRELLEGQHTVFDPAFVSGEDIDFFRRMIVQGGKKFIWCQEAVAYELVPQSRCKLSFLLRRALMRGTIQPKHPTFGVRRLATSTVAVPLYILALPFFFLVGRHLGIKYLVKLCDHLGVLLACVGIASAPETYVTE